MTSAELLAAGGAALGRRAWAEAEDLYGRALAEEESPDALEGLAVARWWQDDVDAAIAARERAYALRRGRGETVEAARVAGFLAWDYGAMRGAHAVANGWLQRARRLVEDLPPSAEHAWLPLIEASFHLDTDAQAVLRLSREAGEEARDARRPRHRDDGADARGARAGEPRARSRRGRACSTRARRPPSAASSTTRSPSARAAAT